MSDDPDIRRKALLSLDEPNTSKAVSRLIGRLGPDAGNRQRAVRALTEIGAPAADPLLAVVARPYENQGLWWRDDYYARLGAAEALGAIGEVRAVRVLLRSLGLSTLDAMSDWPPGHTDNARSNAYATAADNAIVAIGEPAARALLDDARNWRADGPMLPPLYRSLLARIGRNGHLGPIIEALGEPRLSRDAAYILARTGDATAVPALAGVLESGDRRYDAAFALACIGGESAQEALAAFEARNKAEIERALDSYAAVLGQRRALTAAEADLYLFLHVRHETPAMTTMLLQSTDSFLYTAVRSLKKPQPK